MVTMNEFEEQLELDRIKIRSAVRYQLPIEITSYTLPRNMEIYIRRILEIFLNECRQDHMYECLNFCLGELLTNSKKANTKRVYFNELNLDINNKDDYEVGMENFKVDTLTNIDHYLELQKKAGLYIKLVLQNKGDQIKVEISNNATMTVFEKERVQKKLDSVQQFDDMQEVFTNVLDQSEGAGLGIIIIVLMLKKIGLSKDNFQINSENGITTTKIILPCNKRVFAGNEILTYEFVTMQDKVPVFSSELEKINGLVASKNEDKVTLKKVIEKDPMLTLLLLKKNCKNNDSTIEIGKLLENCNLLDLEEIYSNSNPELNIVTQTEEQIDMQKHSQKVAYFAYNLANNYHNEECNITPNEMYSLGLISDMGHLFLDCSGEDQSKYVRDLSSEYEEADKIVDMFYSGSCDPRIAMIYSKKIGLRDDYAGILGCWNNLELASKKINYACKLLYLAQMFTGYSEKKLDFYQIDKDILSSFGIGSEFQFADMLGKLTSGLAE